VLRDSCLVFPLLPPAERDRQGEGQGVIDVDVELVIAFRGMKRLDDEEVIKEHGEKRPDDAEADIAAERIAFNLFEQDPERRGDAERHDVPADNGPRHESVKDEAQHVAEKPEEETPHLEYLSDKHAARMLLILEVTKERCFYWAFSFISIRSLSI